MAKTATDNFTNSFHSIELRQKFEKATGLKVKDNPAAFIGYINFIATDTTFRAIQGLAFRLPNK